MTFFVLAFDRAQERSARFRTSVASAEKSSFFARRQQNPDDDHEHGQQVCPLPARVRLDGLVQVLDDPMLASCVSAGKTCPR